MSFQHLFLPYVAHLPHSSSFPILALCSSQRSFCINLHPCFLSLNSWLCRFTLCRREVNGVRRRLLLLQHPRLPAPPVVYRRSCSKTHPPSRSPLGFAGRNRCELARHIWCFVGPSVTVAKQILISFMTFGYFTIHILYKIKLSVWWKELVWIFVIYWDCTSEILFSCLRSVSLFLLMDFAFCCFMFLLLFVHMNLGSLNISVMVLSYIICRIYSWIISHGIFYS
jgi:hypothetical protein